MKRSTWPASLSLRKAAAACSSVRPRQNWRRRKRPRRASPRTSTGNGRKAQAAGIETIDESKPDEVVARADYRWSAYVKEQAEKGGQFKLDDDAVKKVLADLSKFADKSPDALFLRAQIYELGNDRKKAL